MILRRKKEGAPGQHVLGLGPQSGAGPVPGGTGLWLWFDSAANSGLLPILSEVSQNLKPQWGKSGAHKNVLMWTVRVESPICGHLVSNWKGLQIPSGLLLSKLLVWIHSWLRSHFSGV